MRVKDYYARLNAHDWFYDYSDDHRVWCKGKEERSELYRGFDIDPLFEKMYNDFYEYISGKRDLKPQLEDYV